MPTAHGSAVHEPPLLVVHEGGSMRQACCLGIVLLGLSCTTDDVSLETTTSPIIDRSLNNLDTLNFNPAGEILVSDEFEGFADTLAATTIDNVCTDLQNWVTAWETTHAGSTKAKMIVVKTLSVFYKPRSQAAPAFLRNYYT